MLQRSKTRSRQRLSLGRRLLRDRVLLLFALPGTALIIAFHYVPLLGNVIAFKDYQPFLGIGGSDWSGWANFSVIFNGDPAFLRRVEEHADPDQPVSRSSCSRRRSCWPCC